MKPPHENAWVLRDLWAPLADEMHLSGGSPSSIARFLRAGRYYQKLLLQSSQVIDKVEI